jgi:hypothetical protein
MPQKQNTGGKKRLSNGYKGSQDMGKPFFLLLVGGLGQSITCGSRCVKLEAKDADKFPRKRSE